MPTFTTATPLAGRVRTELAQRAETYAYLSTIVAQHRRKTFADPATAAATIAAMGRDAAAALAWDAATVAYLNVVGPSLGKPAVPPAVPEGYTITPAADGTGTITYVKPAAATAEKPT